MEINIKCYSKGSNHMNRIEEKKEGTDIYLLLFYCISRLILKGFQVPSPSIMIQKQYVLIGRFFMMTVGITDDANVGNDKA